jgi:hypothetical protein
VPLSNHTTEIRRLIGAFEKEASAFHDVRLTTFFVTQTEASIDRTFARPNHTIMLWQYWGAVDSGHDGKELIDAFGESNLNWALRGARVSRFALIDGPKYDLFVRMAKRAGSLFDQDEVTTIAARVLDEIWARERETNPKALPVGVANRDPLAVWINFLLYHLSLTHPGREKSERIEPDPFALSLLALERLAEDGVIGKVDRSTRRIDEVSFKVALSFPGEHRAFVSVVAEALRNKLGSDAVFYDFDYQTQLARPNLDTLLQEIYRNKSRLLVVFLSGEYSTKEWCGLEWRAIRDIIKTRQDERVMFVRFDDVEVPGVFSIDGFVDARRFDATSVADLVLKRLASLGQ